MSCINLSSIGQPSLSECLYFWVVAIIFWSCFLGIILLVVYSCWFCSSFAWWASEVSCLTNIKYYQISNEMKFLGVTNSISFGLYSTSEFSLPKGQKKKIGPFLCASCIKSQYILVHTHWSRSSVDSHDVHTWPTINPRRKNRITENMDNVTGTTTPKNVDNFFLLSGSKSIDRKHY